MPKLIHAVETEFVTDFAILTAGQDGVDPDPGYLSFAVSSPGLANFRTGTKYSRVSIRAERWGSRPPIPDDWEDQDDIPFEEVPTAGKLILSGVDPSDVGLDVSGLGRGRVRVLARGRHRYHYGSPVDVDSIAPEDWLLQLYPQDGPIDPMAGGPRRIAGTGGFSRTMGSPWRAAVLGFRATGWSDRLVSSHGYYLAELALLSATASLTRLELASRMARLMPPGELGGPDAETLAIPPRPSLRGEVDPLAELSGRTEIATIGDTIDALVSIGLLLVEERAGMHLLAPNPSPQPAWERLGLTGERLVWARTRALEEHLGSASDIAKAVLWRGDKGLTTTPRAMAIRWCTEVDDIVGGLRLLGGSLRVTADRDLGFDTELDADQPITLWKATPIEPA